MKKLTVRELKHLNEREPFFEVKLRREFNEQISSVCVLRSKFWAANVIIEASGQYYMVTNLSKGEAESEMSGPISCDARQAVPVCPYFVGDNINWCHFHKINNKIRFEHEVQFQVGCRQLPKLISEIDFDRFCLYDPQAEQILYINISGRNCDMIPLSNLGIKSVECVKRIREDFLCVWSLQSRCVVFVRRLSGLWGVVDRAKWTNPKLKIVTFEEFLRINIICYPAVQMKQGTVEEDSLVNVYCVRFY